MDILLFSIMYVFILIQLVQATLKNTKNRIYIKMLLSTLFLVFAAFNYFFNNLQLGSLFLLLGLCFSFLGDLFLGIKQRKAENQFFILGILFFAITHIFYILFFSQYLSIPWFGIVVILLIWWHLYQLNLKSYFDFSVMKPYVFAYATIISIMFSFAISVVLTRNTNYLIYTGLAGIFFTISDYCLMHVYFNKKAPTILVPIYLVLYYGAQLLIAFTILFNAQ